MRKRFLAVMLVVSLAALAVNASSRCLRQPAPAAAVPAVVCALIFSDAVIVPSASPSTGDHASIVAAMPLPATVDGTRLDARRRGGPPPGDLRLPVQSILRI